MILEKRRIDWKTVLLIITGLTLLYIAYTSLNNKTLTLVFYYVALPLTILYSIYKLLPRR